MKKVLFKSINQNNDCQKLYYSVKREQFTLTLKLYNKKDIFKLNFAKIIKKVSLDKNNTKKLFDIIPEEKLIDYFGNDNGFLMFQNFCLENNIDHNYTSEMKR